ncbi:Hypothetical predicted protein [Podarcis lilfordi]|uniref:Uncharacterized protein n=1 Tax=Podarcis lilfordi TaxID=74358 RepID=A0AA35KNG4_9SAUR|nr:Hypothetical predicted protein [Podarcis lilfordi]
MMNRKKQQKTRLQIAPPEGMRWRVMSRYYHWRVNMRMLMQFQNQRSERLNRSVPPLRLSCIAGLEQPLEPSTWEEIEQMPVAEAALWKDAMQEEFDALHQNKTWTLTKLPPGKKAIGSTPDKAGCRRQSSVLQSKACGERLPSKVWRGLMKLLLQYSDTLL